MLTNRRHDDDDLAGRELSAQLKPIIFIKYITSISFKDKVKGFRSSEYSAFEFD